MTTYGISNYGRPNLYGPSRAATVVPGGPAIPLVNNAYLIDPFTATPINYFSVLLTWNGPDPTTDTPMNEFRLLSSRYGFPVDENDGTILLDTTSLPGTQFVDQTVVPGQISYYGFYILGANSQWIRSGFTACLMPVNHGYPDRLWAFLPEYLRDVQDNELTANAAGDTYLSQFLAVAGWSMDYLKTQYDFLFSNQNHPMKMSFSDLADLAGQLGMPFSGEIPAYFLRKAADNWATVMRQRGSLTGISEHMSLLSGYGADVQISRNIMLENDQSLPWSPRFSPWSGGIPYRVGEIVSWPVYPEWVPSQSYVVNNFVVYNGVNYGCIATGGAGVPPTGALTSSTYWTVESGPYFYKCTTAITSLPGTAPPAAPAAGLSPNGSNSNWQLVYDQDAGTSYLAIPGLSGGVNTWEVLGAATGSTTPHTAAVAAGSLTEGIGTHNPLNFANDYAQNTLRVYNKSGSTEDTWLRSVSRMAADITAGSAVPDPQTVIEHAIPVPQTNATLNEWRATERYATGDVVLWNGRNYLALRASTGATPPALGVALNQNYDFETGVSPWVAGNAGSAVAQSSAFAYHGTHSLRLTPSGSQATVSAISERVSVIPLASYSARAFVYIAAGYAGTNTGVVINWFDAWGNYISSSAAAGVAVTAATWTRVTVTGQAPANAATGQMIVQLAGTPAASVVSYWDLARLACTATPEWQPLGIDARIPLMISAETSQNLSVGAAEQFAVTPFVEWYDNWGTLITRAFARTLSNYTFDAFSSDANMPLAGRMTDTKDQTWTTATGAWLLDGNGNVYPATSGQASMALVAAAVSATQAVTFTEAPQSGVDSGLIFWWQNSTTYWHAGMNGLWYNHGGTWTEALSFPPAFQPGDRIYVVTNQATPSITVYRNSLTSTPVATLSGAGVPAAVRPASNATVYSGIASEAVSGALANAITVSNPGSETSTVGVAVSLQFSATDSATGQTLTFTASGLPAGLSISSSGLITGSPTTAGTATATVIATDTTGAQGSASFSWTVATSGTNTITVTNPGSQSGTVGTAASLTISATDSAGGQTLTYTATGLPAGLSISTSGHITGTPTTAATSTVVVTATDTTSAHGSATFSWAVSSAAALKPSWDPSGSYTVIFDDEFTGTSLDTTKWATNWDGGVGPVNSSESVTYKPANVTVSGGFLNLALTGATGQNGSIVTTNPNGTGASPGFATGPPASFEARVNLASDGVGPANWPAWWLDGQSWPTTGEIDIVEGLGDFTAYHIHDAANPNGIGANAGQLTGWHTFGCSWVGTTVKFYYDGALVGTETTDGFTGPLYLIFDNTCAGGTADYDGNDVMQVDWVRVWTPA